MTAHDDRESWAQIPDSAEHWASSTGQIATLKPGGGFAHLSQRQNQFGEMMVTVKIAEKMKQRLVAGLILAAFGHPRPGGYRLGYHDGDPSNVALKNLLWERKGQARVVDLKERRCLGPRCNVMFMSSGPGNRLCPTCTSRISNITLSGLEGAEESSGLPDEPLYGTTGNPHK